MKTRPLIPLVRGLSVVTLAWACGHSPAAEIPSLPEAITVSAGLQPTIEWTPGGEVHQVLVERDGSAVVFWAATSPQQTNAIGSPVVYGTTPDGAIMTADRINPLFAGVTYRVTLFRYNGVRLEAVGATTFAR